MRFIKMFTPIKRSILLIGIGLLSISSVWSQDSTETISKLANSPHDFTSYLDSLRIASGEEKLSNITVCRQCHAPSLKPGLEPLWDRQNPGTNFHVDKHKKDLSEGLPTDGGSRRCLACHDGVMAKGFPKRDVESQVSLEKDVNSHLYTHLFNMTSSNIDSALHVYNSRVSCGSCHNPHNNDNGSFLRISTQDGALCLGCHVMPNWEISSHVSPLDERYGNHFMKDGCLQCHDIHGTPGTTSLLAKNEAELCLACHDASINNDDEITAKQNLKEVFEKPYAHPIFFESGKGDDGLNHERGVLCSDCHNPHEITHFNEPMLNGALKGVDGVDEDGNELSASHFEYEICAKCHNGNSEKMLAENIDRLFSPMNQSFHPVKAPGNNPNVPSLKKDLSEQSLITCSDCHGNNDKAGAAGPHGSDVAHILKFDYSENPFASPGSDDLCMSCHNLRRLKSDVGFKFHSLHINQGNFACAACHNPHGRVNEPGLVDIDLPWILAVNGEKSVEAREPGHGNCTLSCHGVDHRGQSY
jgi:predicted CXXCH cytochrome family protein